MSWKNIKEHYRIEHHVQMSDGRICIGSGYCPELIVISADGQVSEGSLGVSNNEDLERYYNEMMADLGKVKGLMDSPDSFDISLPVYTYSGGEVIEKMCEAYGWPNVTHDGCMQYNNTYHQDKDVVIEWAKRSAEEALIYQKDRVKEDQLRLKESRDRLAARQADLAKLKDDYPEIEQ